MTGESWDQAQQAQRAQQARQTRQAPQTTWSPFAALEEVALLALGAVDLALDQVRQATGRGEDVVRRSDLRELVADGVKELRARGELASKRGVAADDDNYLELMARRAAGRRERADGARTPAGAGPAHA
ncbi:hypothetical protein [Streptomyces sp. NPDC058612]|uniref:hypothetical protein n=1 Tax=Streptomyces sp. NPDC058612 TaxID=3346555 RepID=UPI0036509E49